MTSTLWIRAKHATMKNFPRNFQSYFSNRFGSHMENDRHHGQAGQGQHEGLADDGPARKASRRIAALDCHQVSRRQVAQREDQRLLDAFFLPYLTIRNRGEGYAVSIVKAGATIVGKSAGPVRPPISDLKAAEVEELAALIGKLGPQ